MPVSLVQKARQFRDRLAISPTSRSVRAQGLTYLSEPKIRRIESALRDVRDVPGCTAEFGVALGGSGIIIASLAQDRCFHGFDVFETIPEPTSEKDDEKSKARFRTIAAGEAKGLKGASYYGYRPDLFGDVVAAFAKNGVPVDGLRVRLYRGLFEEIVPSSDLGALAFAHIDCDWYDPVTYCLAEVADRLNGGGVIVIDDYHDYGGCRTAVDEFLSSRSDFTFEDGPNPILRKRRG
jgi:asparagine synthase (glutamine-hydrolysing)